MPREGASASERGAWYARGAQGNGRGPMTADARLVELLREHSAAVREYVERAAAFPAERWQTPRAPGKWTPAQETRHLVLAYEHFVRDLRGERAIPLKGKWWQRRLWRFLFLGKILDGHFPKGARAPREIRPPDESTDPPALAQELRQAAAHFEETVRDVSHSAPKRGGNHPYFGKLSLAQVVRFSTAHTRHHLRQGLGRRGEG